MKLLTLLSMVLIIFGWAAAGDGSHDDCDCDGTCEVCTCEQTADECSGDCCDCDAEECENNCTCECDDCDHTAVVEVVESHCEDGGCHGGGCSSQK